MPFDLICLSAHTPAVLHDFKLAFTLSGIAWCEPVFANLAEEKGSQVHGVAFCMSKESMEKLDRVETGYLKKMVTLKAYDGRDLDGFVYIKETDRPEGNPSARYLGVLCKGMMVQ